MVGPPFNCAESSGAGRQNLYWPGIDFEDPTVIRVGLISDTHGLLRPEAMAFLRGCDHIVHAGDIGGAELLASLGTLAPVTAVRGNNDADGWGRTLPHQVVVAPGGLEILAIHDLKELDRTRLAPSVRVVVSGHSHRPDTTWRDGVLFINPGSAGPRRFKLPITVAELLLEGGEVRPRTVVLAPA